MPVTNWMILINVLVFLHAAFRGGINDSDILLCYGASYTPYIFENHEYWRLLTAALLHSDVRYPGNNMLVLFVTGDNLEHAPGHVKYLVFYLLLIVDASAASLATEVAAGQKVFSTDASGMVFTMFGDLVRVLIRGGGCFKEFRIRNLLFFSGMMLPSGFFTEGVDNVTYADGLLVGFLLAVVLY